MLPTPSVFRRIRERLNAAPWISIYAPVFVALDGIATRGASPGHFALQSELPDADDLVPFGTIQVTRRLAI
jgi:hypothetical protein